MFYNRNGKRSRKLVYDFRKIQSHMKGKFEEFHAFMSSRSNSSVSIYLKHQQHVERQWYETSMPQHHISGDFLKLEEPKKN